MKNWNETAQLVHRLLEITGGGGRAVLATVIGVQGSAYRREGAKLLIDADGNMMGNVSGGCLEGDLRERAAQVLQTGQPTEVTYDTSDDADTLWGLGMGCNGVVQLFLQEIDPFRHRELLEDLARRLAADAPFAWCTWLGPDDKAGRNQVHSAVALPEAMSGKPPPAFVAARLTGQMSGVDHDADKRVFTEILLPPPRLLLCGGGEDAGPLADAADRAGFRVLVLDHRAAFLRADLFPASVQCFQCRSEDASAAELFSRASMVVIKTHHTGHDAGWLQKAVASDVKYIGLLGPRARRDALLSRLGCAGDPRLYGPVGLNLGAVGSEQIAVSIVAELLVVHAGQSPVHLRDRPRTA